MRFDCSMWVMLTVLVVCACDYGGDGCGIGAFASSLVVVVLLEVVLVVMVEC